ncbi:hypothetical protein [Mycoplasma sp. OR1901]|uniref:hypothetical protein n=1 Tax=Mycoplasma sp. OR1901 TaxID=2742195 RepID=UPI0015833554|nr:hypothetical protein [Mycoplasma sp. OR1901]QKT05359.1 hypothetical protein HTZ87_01430 [Mycoplasma sp. OR1901]
MKFKTKWFKGLVIALPFVAAGVTLGTVVALKNGKESPEKIAYIKVINEATKFLDSTTGDDFSEIKNTLKAKVDQAKEIVKLDNKKPEELKVETQKLTESFEKAKADKETVLVLKAKNLLKSRLNEVKTYIQNNLAEDKYSEIKKALQAKYDEFEAIEKLDGQTKEKYRETTKELNNAWNKAKSDAVAKDEEIKRQEEEKRAIESLKSEINQIKTQITEENTKLDERFKDQKAKVVKKLETFVVNEPETKNNLETTKQNLMTFKTSFDAFVNDVNVANEILKSNNEFNNVNDTETVLAKLNELLNGTNQKTTEVNDKVFLVTDDDKNKFFNWELGENKSTFRKNDTKERYTEIFKDVIPNDDLNNIVSKLVSTTGLKNMFAVLLGQGENYNDLYWEHSDYIIKKDMLNQEKYNNGYQEYKTSNNGEEGLHPRLLENWLIFNWHFDGKPEFGDDVNKINDKINELFLKLTEANDVDTFKQTQFTELNKRINDFIPLAKEELNEDKKSKAKEYSEAYLSSYLNLAILKYEVKKYLTEKSNKITKATEAINKINDFLKEIVIEKEESNSGGNVDGTQEGDNSTPKEKEQTTPADQANPGTSTSDQSQQGEEVKPKEEQPSTSSETNGTNQSQDDQSSTTSSTNSQPQADAEAQPKADASQPQPAN